MNIKKYLKLPIQYHRNIGLIWKYGGVVRKLGLIHLLIPALLIPAAIVTFTQIPNVRVSAAKFTKPKPIVQSPTILSANIQSAIQNLAVQEIKAEAGNANLAVNILSSSLTQPSQNGLIQPLIDSIQETLIQDPASKAKIKLRIIDREIAELQNLLEKDKSEKAADQAVKIIGDIGKKTKAVATDPKVQTDREILKLQIEQYNRFQLLLQKLEDDLPVASYLKIEDARVKYLVSGAIASLNAAPNLDAVHNIAIKEVGRLVGDDFAELKAIEVLSDIESGLNPETKVKLAGLQKELAIQFEKRMLKLPPDVRNRKLQNYINYSFGNPVRQVQAYEQMKNFLTDRELILSLEGVKELALGKLKDRVFEINTPETRKQFWDEVFKDPKDIRVMALLQMYIQSGTSEADKKEFAQHEDIARARVVVLFGQYPQALEAIAGKDILDLSIVSQIDQILENSPQVSPEVKLKAKQVLDKTRSTFLSSVSQKDFVSKPKLAYNPVTDASDVRLLSPNPQAILLLRSLGDILPAADQQKINTALRAQASLLSEHLLTNVNDPEIFETYQAFITSNPQVKQVLQNYLGQRFFTSLSQKAKAIIEEDKKNQQVLYEKMQQIVQQIFVSNDNQKSDLEKQLPADIQNEIQKLKTELADNNVPKIETPQGLTLPEIAKLPENIENAILAAAKKKIEAENRPKDVELDLTVSAKDLGVSDPLILPGNPLYALKEILRDVILVITLDPIARAEKLIEQDNVKTIEAAKLLQQSQDTKTIDLALDTLKDVQEDFAKLAEHANELKQLEPAKVDQLVDQIIENGVARQTVLASIEDKVYGDTYVEVEQIRSDILKDGVETLLELTNNNVESLTDKLEQAVEQVSGSDLSEIRAIELLTEIKKDQPKELQPILENSIDQLTQKLEEELLQLPEQERVEKVLDYIEASPGNPVIQFQAADELKDHFNDPQLVDLAEGIKDAAVENLTNLISEITDGTSKQKFVDIVVGDTVEDLKIITDVEIRVTPPEADVTGETTPIVEEIREIKAEIEQNIIDRYVDNPEQLAQDVLPEEGHATDILDVNVIQEIVQVLERSPEVAPEVIKEAQKLKTEVINNFVETVSTETNQALTPVPEVIEQLVELKNDVPPSIDVKIDLAIKAEVELIQNHLEAQVNDPLTFETYITQIEQNPVVENVISQVGGAEFTAVIEQKTAEIQATASEEQTTLIETVKQIEQEIFTSPVSQPSVVEQTLPEEVQAQIQEIKQEVPVEQVPEITVEATVTVSAPTSTTEPASTSEPVSVPAEAPAPAAPEVQQPTTTEAAPAAPAAPAVGL